MPQDEEWGKELPVHTDEGMTQECERIFALVGNLPPEMMPLAEACIARARTLLAGEKEGPNTFAIPMWECMDMEYDASDALGAGDRPGAIRLAKAAWTAHALECTMHAARAQRRARWRSDYEHAAACAATAAMWAEKVRNPNAHLRFLRVGPWVAVAR